MLVPRTQPPSDQEVREAAENQALLGWEAFL